MPGGKFSLEAVFSVLDKISAPLAKIRGKFDAFGKGATKALQGANRAVDKGLAGIGKFSNVLGIGAVASVAGIGFELKNIITLGAAFESTLIRAGSAFDTPIKKGTAGFKELTDAARLVGRTTEFSAQQAAEGINSLATAGFTAKQSISALPKIIDFASAGGLELGIAADIASNTLGAFGLRSADAGKNALNMGRAMDVMVRAAADSTTNVTEIFEAMKMGGSSAASAGASIEEFTGMAGVLAAAGKKGSDAGTAIRNSFMHLTNATPEAIKMMKHLGVTIAKTKDGSLDMTTTIGRFAKATKNLTGIQKSAAIGNIFGAYTQGAFLDLMNAGEGTIRKYTASLQNAAGTTKTMAETMREGTQAKIQKFFNILEDVRLGVFEAISGTVLEIADSIGKWVTANQELINTKAAEWSVKLKDALPDIYKYTVLIAKALAGFLILAGIVKTVTLLVTVIGWLSTAFAWLEFTALLLGTSIAAVALPVILVGAAIAGLVALAWAYWPEITGFFTSVKDWAVAAFDTMWSGIKSGFAAAKTFLTASFEFVVGLLTLVFAPGVAAAKWFVGVVGGLLESTVAWIKEAWVPIGAFFSGVWDEIVTAATSFYDALVGVFEPLGAWFSSVWTNISDSFMRIVGPIIDTAKGIIDTIRTVGRISLGTADEEGGAVGGVKEAPPIVGPHARAAQDVVEGNAANATVDGKIVVEATKGTKATVKAQPKKIPIRVQHSGAFP
jgi:TP901 family phage tail tape measure protein